jgi:hypothetical protein
MAAPLKHRRGRLYSLVPRDPENLRWPPSSSGWAANSRPIPLFPACRPMAPVPIRSATNGVAPMPPHAWLERMCGTSRSTPRIPAWFQGIQHFLKVHDGPSHAVGNHFWLKAVSEAAVSNGARVLLTGQMGNSSVSWSGNGSALLALIQRRPREAFQLVMHSEPNLWLTIKRHMLKPVLTPAQRLQKRLRAGGGMAWRTYSALNPRMATAVDLDERMSAAGHDFAGSKAFVRSAFLEHRS